MKIDTAFLGADHVLNILGVEDSAGTPQTDATVQVTEIIDAASGAAVTGQSFPVGGTHIGNGDYQVALTRDLAFVAGRQYQARGTITIASGSVLPFRHTFEAEYFETPIG